MISSNMSKLVKILKKGGAVKVSRSYELKKMDLIAVN